MKDNFLECTWLEFEARIRTMIGSNFRWLIHPEDTHSNRKMIINVILEDIEMHGGHFPDKNEYIERIKNTG